MKAEAFAFGHIIFRFWVRGTFFRNICYASGVEGVEISTE